MRDATRTRSDDHQDRVSEARQTVDDNTPGESRSRLGSMLLRRAGAVPNVRRGRVGLWCQRQPDAGLRTGKHCGQRAPVRDASLPSRVHHLEGCAGVPSSVAARGSMNLLCRAPTGWQRRCVRHDGRPGYPVYTSEERVG